MKAKSSRVVQFGLGSIGSESARLLHEREGTQLVGGIDWDQHKVGKDVGVVIGLNSPLGFHVVDAIQDLPPGTDADVVVHTTTSLFSEFMPQILEVLESGYDIVSTSEELVYPWLHHPEESKTIDRVAKKVGKTVLATGVNPGFLMDLLPITLSGICQRVERIGVRRVINASTRRQPFQVKIGLGISPGEFEKRVNSGGLGHSGLRESAHMLLTSLGKTIGGYHETVEPILADDDVETEHVTVKAGDVSGIKQVASVISSDREFLNLTFIAEVDTVDEGDTISIEGKPIVEIALGGTNGDVATAAIAVNAIPSVRVAEPGLKTVPNLPAITWWP